MFAKSSLSVLLIALFGCAINCSNGIQVQPRITNVACGSSSSSKNLGFVNPTNPPIECVYTINAYSSTVCQIRFDFDLTLAGPKIPNSDNGLNYAECIDDYVEFGGFKLCGNEVGQHLYVPFNRTAGVKSLQIKVRTAHRSGGNLSPALWNIKVNQLQCPSGSPLRSFSNEGILPQLDARSTNDGFLIAPPGCLQYFPQTTGVVSSFNYNNGDGIYPGNMLYAICFRRTTETKALELTSIRFRIGQEYNVKEEVNDSCLPQVPTVGRSEDYLLIPQAIISDNQIRATYFCGDVLANKNVKSFAPGPLEIIFNSDKLYRTPEKGFQFNYSTE